MAERDRQYQHINNVTCCRLRVFDGGAAAYGALSRGLIDICLNGVDLDAYDICALRPVVQEAGGTISNWMGHPPSLASGDAILAVLRRTSTQRFWTGCQVRIDQTIRVTAILSDARYSPIAMAKSNPLRGPEAGC